MIPVWTIAGSDSSGGAGIQADLKTFQQFGVHGASIITAVTSQNSHQLTDIHFINPKHIYSQIDILQQEKLPQAIKIGMLGDIEIIKKVANFLCDYSGHVIIDPVFKTTSGKQLFKGELENYLKNLITIFKNATLITPNLPEAEIFFGRKINSLEDIKNCAMKFLDTGVKNVLIKGGHRTTDSFSQDYWTNGTESAWFVNKRYTGNYRGTGCTLSSAITACLALGYSLKDALVIAKMYVTQGIRTALQHQSTYLFNPESFPEQEEDLPYVVDQPISSVSEKFPQCEKNSIGLYPVVDSIKWLEKLLPLGVNTIQLRIKNKKGLELEQEIAQSCWLAKRYHTKLFINDYWELAIQYNAYGVHLGQEDILKADIEKIRAANLHLGISTHSYYEIARTHAFKPSYIAFGPVFSTTSKIMPWKPQGLSQLQRIRRTLNYPLVAIGGINSQNLASVVATKVDGFALIGAITQAENPIEATRELLKVSNGT